MHTRFRPERHGEITQPSLCHGIFAMNDKRKVFMISLTVASVTLSGIILSLYASGAIKTANNEKPPFIAIVILVMIVITLVDLSLKSYYKHQK